MTPRLERQALQATWRERALNSEDALKAAHAEILRQREHIAELLGQIRDLNTGSTEDDRIRMSSENLALKRAVRDQETEVRSLADKLAAARENNRVADRRIAALEARIAEPHWDRETRLAGTAPTASHDDR
jgi:chromosome segregation ATPase